VYLSLERKTQKLKKEPYLLLFVLTKEYVLGQHNSFSFHCFWSRRPNVEQEQLLLFHFKQSSQHILQENPEGSTSREIFFQNLANSNQALFILHYKSSWLALSFLIPDHEPIDVYFCTACVCFESVNVIHLVNT
jgi:hypothetical protein